MDIILLVENADFLKFPLNPSWDTVIIDVVLSFFLVTTILSLLHQIYLVWRDRSVEVLAVFTLWSNVISNGMAGCYAYVYEERSLCIFLFVTLVPGIVLYVLAEIMYLWGLMGADISLRKKLSQALLHVCLFGAFFLLVMYFDERVIEWSSEHLYIAQILAVAGPLWQLRVSKRRHTQVKEDPRKLTPGQVLSGEELYSEGATGVISFLKFLNNFWVTMAFLIISLYHWLPMMLLLNILCLIMNAKLLDLFKKTLSAAREGRPLVD